MNVTETTESELTLLEQSELEKNEAVIERGLQTFVDVGNALMAIRDGRLYRQTHKTFEEYCDQRWSLSNSSAYNYIAAAQVAENVQHAGQIPSSIRQALPLSPLTPDQQRAAWQEAIETAPDGKITGAHVASVAEQYKPPVVQEKLSDIEISEPETVDRQKPKINRAGDQYVPQGFDACQTPPYAIDPLLPYLSSNWLIWEPACGEGLLVEALYDSGFKTVLMSDLLTGQNFFDYDPGNWDCLITNPPYSIKYPWLERCYQLGKPFALLLPVETLGAKTAQTFFRTIGLEIILLDQRINFKMPNIGWDGSSAQFPVAWFTWGLSIGHQMTFAEIKRND